jgi:CBS-domain-containing membrane protein
MSTGVKAANSARLKLDAVIAADIMAESPISVSEDATVQEAITLLVEHGFGAAPVIDAAGRAVGVLSRSDLIAVTKDSIYHHDLDTLANRADGPSKAYQIVNVNRTHVREIMTPTVFSVTPNTPAATVVRELLALAVHRLFVVDETGVLVGVISATDILRRLN